MTAFNSGTLYVSLASILLEFAGKSTEVVTKRLKLDVLKKLSNRSKPLFGHQGANLFGTTWDISTPQTSKQGADIRSVTGCLEPAVVGFDFEYATEFWFGKGESENWVGRRPNFLPRHKTQFAIDTLKAKVIEAHQLGALITFSYHMFLSPTGDTRFDQAASSIVKPSFSRRETQQSVNPHLVDSAGKLDPSSKLLNEYERKIRLFASFAAGLKSHGVTLLFRPLHEFNGHWFWWCQSTATKKPNVPASTFKLLWKRTHAILQAEGATNVLLVYSPNAASSAAALQSDMARFWPGNTVVDIIGLDYYLPASGSGSISKQTDQFVAQCQTAADFAASKKMPFAISETGLHSGQLTYNGSPIKTYFTKELGPALERIRLHKAGSQTLLEKPRSISWVLLWQNRDADHSARLKTGPLPVTVKPWTQTGITFYLPFVPIPMPAKPKAIKVDFAGLTGGKATYTAMEKDFRQFAFGTNAEFIKMPGKQCRVP